MPRSTVKPGRAAFSLSALPTPFWKLTSTASRRACFLISFAAASVAWLFTHKAIRSASAIARGLVENSTSSGRASIRRPSLSVIARPLAAISSLTLRRPIRMTSRPAAAHAAPI
jgi:hypothetical protein